MNNGGTTMADYERIRLVILGGAGVGKFKAYFVYTFIVLVIKLPLYGRLVHRVIS